MTFEEYQIESRKTDIYPHDNTRIHCYIHGLCSEAGELAGLIKKSVRDNGGYINPDKFRAEIGDCLWYIARLIEISGKNFQAIAQENIEKLRKRKQNGTIQGSGDNR
jgi:NTP pyrophosphatase (non-canonical NTP hydrolase)